MVSYDEYKRLQCIFNMFKNINIYLDVVVVLNNNKRIHGFVLSVNHNKFTILSKSTGKIINLSYTSVKKMDLVNEYQIKIYKMLEEKIDNCINQS